MTDGFPSAENRLSVTDAPGETTMSGPGLLIVDEVNPHPAGPRIAPQRVKETAVTLWGTTREGIRGRPGR